MIGGERSSWANTSIAADGGRSNGTGVRLWKVAKLADETGLVIHAHHYPPCTSKWGKIEHRLFRQNWRGWPLTGRLAGGLLASASMHFALCRQHRGRSICAGSGARADELAALLGSREGSSGVPVVVKVRRRWLCCRRRTARRRRLVRLAPTAPVPTSLLPCWIQGLLISVAFE
jgi:hypothetical protein